MAKVFLVLCKKMFKFRHFIVITLYFYTFNFINGLNGEPSLSKTFNIAGIFPKLSSAPFVAARMAIEDINTFASQTGRNTFNRIALITEETKCQSQAAAALMYKIMSTGPPKPVIIAGCPEDCDTISKAAPVWNSITICYGISEYPYYESRSHLPSLFLAQPHRFSVIHALVKFIQHYGWKRVAILHHDYGNYLDIAHQLTFSLDHTEVLWIEASSSKDLPQALDQVKQEDARIILTLASESFSREILCHSYHRGLFGPDKYVWFFLGSHRKEWFLENNSASEEDEVGSGDEDMGNNNIRFDCKPEELIQAADGHFTTKALLWNPNEQIKTISGMTVGEFKSKLLYLLKQNGEHVNPIDFDEAPLAYDAVWAAYLALNRTAEFECTDGKFPCEFSYENYGFQTQFAMINNLKFQGVSGEVAFNEEGYRSIGNACIKIARYKNNQETTVAWHYNYNNTFSLLQDPFGANIPIDGNEEDESPPQEKESSTLPNCNLASGLVINTYSFIFLLLIVYINS